MGDLDVMNLDNMELHGIPVLTDNLKDNIGEQINLEGGDCSAVLSQDIPLSNSESAVKEVHKKMERPRLLGRRLLKKCMKRGIVIIL